MVCRCSNRSEHIDIYYDNERLEVVDTFIYLGVNLSSNASLYKAQKHLSEQASRALYSLNSLFESTHLGIQDKLKLFDALVSPIMNYGSEVWGFHNSQDIERVHLRFLKKLLNVRQQTSNMTIYGELGLLATDRSKAVVLV